MPQMYDFRKILKKRLYSCLLYATLLLVFGIGIYFTDTMLMQTKQTECDQKTQADFDKMVNQICSELNRCKTPAQNLIQQLQEDSTFDFHNEEQVYTALEKLLKENPVMSGAIMGFEDWAYPQYTHHNGFGPLVRRTGEYIDRLQIGEFRDFRSENEWYQRQLQEPVSEWSKPFLSDDGVMIATYTMPLFENGRYMGGFGIDVDLSYFANLADVYRPYPSSFLVMVDADLNILIHPNRDYIGTTKLTEAMQRVGINPDAHPLYHSRDRQGGVDYDYMGQHRMAFYYAPIAGTNWMVLLYCHTDEIYASMQNIHYMMMIISIIVIIFLSTLLCISIYRYARDLYRFRTPF